MASKEGSPNLVQAPLAAARAQGTPFDAHVYNALLDMHARFQDSEAFHSVLVEMREAALGATPASHVSYCKLLEGTASPEAVYEHVHSLCKVQSDGLSEQLFTVQFTVAAKDPGMDFAKMRDMWQEMVSAGIAANKFVLGAFFSACKGLALEPKQVETCFGMLADFRAAGQKAPVGILCNLLQVCSANGFSIRVLDIWKMATDDNLGLNPYVCSAMLVCCKKIVFESQGVPTLVHSISTSLEHRWIEQSVELNPCWRVENSYRGAFNALLSYHASAEDFEAGMATLQVC
jgi:hypothetical protein